MASHRRPKQPSRARVNVLTAAAAAAVALSSQAAHADPKPSKADVKAEVDKLYHEAEAATEKFNGAKEQQDKLKKQVDALQDKVARGQEELNTLRGELGSIATAQYRSGGIDPSVQLFLASDPDDFLDQASALDQLTAKQTESLQKIQSKQRTLAQQRKEAQAKLGDLAEVRKTLGENKKKSSAKLAEARRLLNTLTVAERAKMDADEQRASRAAGDRVELGNEVPASARGAAALQGRRDPDRQAVLPRRHRPRLLRLLRADPVGLRPGQRPDLPRHLHPGQRRPADRAQRAEARRPGVLQQHLARGPVRGQQPDPARPEAGRLRPVRVDELHGHLPVRRPRRLTPERANYAPLH
ncbi:peptidoglycan hydrolase CwlO-like protein [Streptomyces sp. TE33382]